MVGNGYVIRFLERQSLFLLLFLSFSFHAREIGYADIGFIVVAA